MSGRLSWSAAGGADAAAAAAADVVDAAVVCSPPQLASSSPSRLPLRSYRFLRSCSRLCRSARRSQTALPMGRGELHIRNISVSLKSYGLLSSY